MPENIYRDVYSSLEKSREAMIKNKTDPTESNTYLFSVGDNVLLSSKIVRPNRPKKFSPRYTGPYKIRKVCSAVPYALEMGDRAGKQTVYHASLL
jgi:hypothetical protein